MCVSGCVRLLRGGVWPESWTRNRSRGEGPWYPAPMSSEAITQRRLRARAMPEVPDAAAVLIVRFLDQIWAELGLSPQTLASYRRDLEGFARWLGPATALNQVDRARLFAYLAWRSEQGYSPRSNARLMSSLRAFYAQQLRTGQMTQDPTALMESPRQGRRLP